MALFGSTSPGYPVMASLDLARAWAVEQGKEAWEVLAVRMKKIKETARKKGLLLRWGSGPHPFGHWYAAGRNDWRGSGGVFPQQGIEPEHEDGAYLVCIVTPFHTEEELNRLEKAVLALPEARYSVKEASALPPLPSVRMAPREAVLAFQESVKLQDAVGRIAGEAACPCPPGVPIVMPGEEITQECAAFLKNYHLKELRVVKEETL